MSASSRNEPAYVERFEELRADDVDRVGGKNASLGEMISRLADAGIRVPGGFAVTAAAYRAFLDHNELTARIRDELDQGNGDGEKIRQLICEGQWPDELERAIASAYDELGDEAGGAELSVAVRSSATAEDLPDASFAGQQDTYLNVRGTADVLDATRRCFASLFTDRAIAYREEQGFGHLEVAISVGVQRMVRADLACAGVAFTIDPETGFPRAVQIDAAWGLGELVVSGQVLPDSYVVFKPLLDREDRCPVVGKELGVKGKKIVFKEGGETETVETSREEQRSFCLTDDEILRLARWCTTIEAHYDRPMDIEWAKDGETGELFIVQARPETVQSQKVGAALKTYRLTERSDVLVEGLAVGDAIAPGPVVRIDDPSQGEDMPDGAIIVTGMTDPDWVPLMQRAGAIVTDHGGRTAHAAIVSRELGLPAVIGTGDATQRLEDGRDVTVSCAEGDVGRVYDGLLDFDAEEIDLDALPEIHTRIMMNIASPGGAFRWWRLPAQGIGLARMEFVINDHIQIHPLALLRFDELDDEEARERIQDLTLGYDDLAEYFVDRLARGIARIAASQHPHRVIVRTSDFKTNEYADLIGGRQFEPEEANPMLGWRGAARYTSEQYREAFALECKALHRVREVIGLDNVAVMIPFVRTVGELDEVIAILADHGLVRGQGGLELYLMCEIPANVVLAHEFAQRIDGFSIGSNDLTQLVLGVDRDSELLAELFDERDPAVQRVIAQVIQTAHDAGVKVGICGQGPSDHPDFAAFLVESGIDTMSLNPDSVVPVIRRVAEFEAAHGA